jgi:hypothetical protein
VLSECDASSHRFWEIKGFATQSTCDRRFSMADSWPHAPPHYFTPHGTYIITAATLHRERSRLNRRQQRQRRFLKDG